MNSSTWLDILSVICCFLQYIFDPNQTVLLVFPILLELVARFISRALSFDHFTDLSVSPSLTIKSNAGQSLPHSLTLIFKTQAKLEHLLLQPIETNPIHSQHRALAPTFSVIVLILCWSSPLPKSSAACESELKFSPDFNLDPFSETSSTEINLNSENKIAYMTVYFPTNPHLLRYFFNQGANKHWIKDERRWGIRGHTDICHLFRMSYSE